MDDRFVKPPKRRSGWHGLVRFWAGMFIAAIAGVALLQAVGPPPRISQRVSQALSPKVTVPNVPAKPIPVRQSSGPAYDEPDRPSDNEMAALCSKAMAQIAQGHMYLPPGDNATETLERIAALASQGTPTALQEIKKVKLTLFERAHAVAAAGDTAEGDRTLSLVAKLPPGPFASDAPSSTGAAAYQDLPVANASPEDSRRPLSVSTAGADAPPPSQLTHVQKAKPKEWYDPKLSRYPGGVSSTPRPDQQQFEMVMTAPVPQFFPMSGWRPEWSATPPTDGPPLPQQRASSNNSLLERWIKLSNQPSAKSWVSYPFPYQQ